MSMQHSKSARLGRVTACAAVGLMLVPVGASSASADIFDPVHTKTLTSGDADTLRVRFYEHGGLSGSVLSYYGGSACSATLGDADYSASSLPSDWNDEISSISDHNSCDVNVYIHTGFVGARGYINYGTGGQNLPSAWNDQISSFRVS